MMMIYGLARYGKNGEGASGPLLFHVISKNCPTTVETEAIYLAYCRFSAYHCVAIGEVIVIDLVAVS